MGFGYSCFAMILLWFISMVRTKELKKRRIIIAVISIIVVAAMVLFDMLYMKKDKKEELPQEEKKVEEIVWITESSIEGVQSEMEEALNALLKKTWM